MFGVGLIVSFMALCDAQPFPMSSSYPPSGGAVGSGGGMHPGMPYNIPGSPGGFASGGLMGGMSGMPGGLGGGMPGGMSGMPGGLGGGMPGGLGGGMPGGMSGMPGGLGGGMPGGMSGMSGGMSGMSGSMSGMSGGMSGMSGGMSGMSGGMSGMSGGMGGGMSSGLAGGMPGSIGGGMPGGLGGAMSGLGGGNTIGSSVGTTQSRGSGGRISGGPTMPDFPSGFDTYQPDFRGEFATHSTGGSMSTFSTIPDASGTGGGASFGGSPDTMQGARQRSPFGANSVGGRSGTRGSNPDEWVGAQGGQSGFPVHGGYCAGQRCADGGLRAGVGLGIGTGTAQAMEHRRMTGQNEDVRMYERFASGPNGQPLSPPGGAGMMGMPSPGGMPGMQPGAHMPGMRGPMVPFGRPPGMGAMGFGTPFALGR